MKRSSAFAPREWLQLPLLYVMAGLVRALQSSLWQQLIRNDAKWNIETGGPREATFACPALQPRAELVEARLESAARPSTSSGRGWDCVNRHTSPRVSASARRPDPYPTKSGQVRSLGERSATGRG